MSTRLTLLLLCVSCAAALGAPADPRVLLFDFEAGAGSWQGNPWRAGKARAEIIPEARFGKGAARVTFEGCVNGGSVIPPYFAEDAPWRGRPWGGVSFWARSVGGTPQKFSMHVETGQAGTGFSATFTVQGREWRRCEATTGNVWSREDLRIDWGAMKRFYLIGHGSPAFEVDHFVLEPVAREVPCDADPVALCPRAAAPPKLDGVLDDACWQAAGRIGGFVEHQGGAPARDATEVRLCHDDEHLYLGARLALADPSKLRAALTRRDAPVYQEDSLEFFLDPGHQGAYSQLALNALGTLMDLSKKEHLAFNAEWQAKTRRDAGGWWAEVSIRTPSLGYTGETAGRSWGFNVGREVPATGEVTCWSCTRGQFLNPERWGQLLFTGAAVPPAPGPAPVLLELGEGDYAARWAPPVGAGDLRLAGRIAGPGADSGWVSLDLPEAAGEALLPLRAKFPQPALARWSFAALDRGGQVVAYAAGRFRVTPPAPPRPKPFLALLPQPKELRAGTGRFALPEKARIAAQGLAAEDAGRIAGLLAGEVKSAYALEWQTDAAAARPTGRPGAVRLVGTGATVVAVRLAGPAAPAVVTLAGPAAAPVVAGAAPPAGSSAAPAVVKMAAGKSANSGVTATVTPAGSAAPAVVRPAIAGTAPAVVRPTGVAAAPAAGKPIGAAAPAAVTLISADDAKALAGLFPKERLAQFAGLPEEGYLLEVTSKGVVIAGKSARGVFYGVQTFLQAVGLSTPTGGRPSCPSLSVADWPDLPVRAVTMSLPCDRWGHPNDAPFEPREFVEYLDRTLVRHKMNTLVLIVGQGVKLDSHPELAGPAAWSKEQLRQVLRFARERYLDVVPLQTILGHANWFTLHYKDLWEDGDYHIACVSHPQTQQILTDVITEIADLFQPRRFHLGMDEAWWKTLDVPEEKRCKLCAGKPKSEIFAAQAIRYHDLLKARGIESMAWGDMLLPEHNGGTPYDTAKALERLPRDLILCNWSTSLAPLGSKRFRDAGFRVIQSNSAGVNRQQAEWLVGNMMGCWSKSPWVSESIGQGTQGFGYLPVLQSAERGWNTDTDLQRDSWALGPAFLDASAAARALLARPAAPNAVGPTRAVALGAAANLSTTAGEPPSPAQWFGLGADESLADLPRGEISVGGMPFTLSGAGRPNAVAFEAEPVVLPLRARVGALAVLAGCHLLEERRTAFLDRFKQKDAIRGVLVGSVRVCYGDGTTESLNLRYGVNVLSWKARDKVQPACYGSAGALLLSTAGQQRRDPRARDAALYALQWANPHPEREVEKVEFLAAGTEAVPFVAALTVWPAR